MSPRPSRARKRLILVAVLAGAVLTVAAAAVVLGTRRSDNERTATRASVELAAGALGALHRVQLEGSETLPRPAGSGVLEAGSEQEPNEELPRTPTDPSAPF